jgi:alkyldihydroxyacetonephosphate synthase
MSRALKDDLAQAVPGLSVSDDPADRVAYARDLWPRHHLAVRAGNVAAHRPGIIVWPRTTSEVSDVVRWAASHRTPVVPFGAGSGVCGGVLPTNDVVILDLKRMARWRNLDEHAPSLEVEAGHMGLPLEEELGRRGFTLGHFPSSILCSTVGGWVAARSAGQCSGYYGKIEDMVTGLECVTGTGEVVVLHRRAHGPDLTPLIIGSEGTLAVVTSATFRLHPAPTSRGFSAFSFASTEAGWEAMRAVLQAGLRPAVSRLYDPFDAMLARMGAVRRSKAPATHARAPRVGPGLGAAALRNILRRPGILNELVDSMGTRTLGGALLVLIFEGTGEVPERDSKEARAIVERAGGHYEGEGPAKNWLAHRYAVSYRQAPIFAAGAFADTMEVAATWTNLGPLYQAVRRALGKHVFVMAHMSHAYADGCCIYFSFAGSAAPGEVRAHGWDGASEISYDRAWRAALAAAIAAGGTLAHHHGVGRSKAPRLGTELGAGIDVVRALKRAFDPHGILNPGNLLPPPAPEPYADDAHANQVLS